MNNEETSLYEGALNPNVKIEKVNDLYKYTVRLHPGIADVGGEFYDFDLFKMEYKDQPLELRTINDKNRIKEFSVTSKDLLEKSNLLVRLNIRKMLIIQAEVETKHMT